MEHTDGQTDELVQRPLTVFTSRSPWKVYVKK